MAFAGKASATPRGSPCLRTLSGRFSVIRVMTSFLLPVGSREATELRQRCVDQAVVPRDSSR
jgi:hypothetical protein